MNREFDLMDERLARYIEVFQRPHMKALFVDLQERLHRGIYIAERDLEDALNGALRGSEFPGDWVGRPDDDDKDADEDDEAERD